MGAFDVRLDERCHALHTHLTGSVTIGTDSYCVDDGSETCQAVWREPKPPPSFVASMGEKVYSWLGMATPSKEAAHSTGVLLIIFFSVLGAILVAILVSCCIKACSSRAREPIVTTHPAVMAEKTGVQLTHLEKAVANQQGAIVTK